MINLIVKYKFYLLPVLLVFGSCQKDVLVDLQYGIETNNQLDILCKSLRLAGNNIEGDMPVGQGSGTALVVGFAEAVEISAGVLLYMPYQVTDVNLICNLFIQIDGANNYWETTLKLDPTSQQPYFEILIPNFVQEGNFDFIFSIEQCDGSISPAYRTATTVSPIADCDTGITGSVGITVRTFDLGEIAGTAYFNYEMYSIPDRLDIRYNGQWVATTASQLFGANVIIPDCNGTTDGFVSDSGQLSINYDPKKGRIVEVYVSGCFSGTLWDIYAICPE